MYYDNKNYNSPDVDNYSVYSAVKKSEEAQRSYVGVTNYNTGSENKFVHPYCFKFNVFQYV